WIWSDSNEPAPKNRFTYFRKAVELSSLPEEATLYFAADSNARLWINGHLVRRKVARYHEEKIRAEAVNAAPYLQVGRNVVVVLHHNWGDIITFQRTGNRRAGLYLDSTWIKTDTSWRWWKAPQFLAHEQQIVGVIKDPRIRYPQIIDGRKRLVQNIHEADFDDSRWSRATEVVNGPWPAKPRAVETPGQREYTVRPGTLLAAGTAQSAQAVSQDPLSIASGIRLSKCIPSEAVRSEMSKLLQGDPIVVAGNKGQTRYLTFDFFRPVHGYPILELGDRTSEGVYIDWGYAEIYRSLYSGQEHVKENGWLNPEGVAGPGYADRYITGPGAQSVELPDERTARWLTLHLYFPEDGQVVIQDGGIVKSQYPIDFKGSFACGNQHMDQIVQLCLIHAEVTMSDSYVDTPGREDGQWIEDARPRALLAARWFGDTRLREFLIRTHAEGQGPDGNLHPFAPSNYPAYPAGYDWSVQWVALLYDDYYWTGNEDRIRQYWDPLCRYWKAVLSLADEEGLWRTPHIFADIRVGIKLRQPHQSSGIVTPWIIERLRWSVEMAKAIGQQEQANQWRRTAEKMTAAFRKYHLVPAQGDVPVHVADLYDSKAPQESRGYSQAGQTVAVYSGLLNRPESLATLEYSFLPPDGRPSPGVTRWNNPTYCYRALLALSHAGLTERAVRHLFERYAPYLPGHPRNQTPLVLQGPYGGPLPEYWVSREDLSLASDAINPAQPQDETGSHGWQAVPLLWLHETLLGVRIVQPGGARLQIAPQTGGLPYVQGHTVTPKGLVWVSWQPQYFSLEIVLPENVTAEVVLPDECRGKPIKIMETAGECDSLDNGRFVIRGGGRYLFQIR
ncbi:MAG: hypothetical protein JW828_04390, partial [Sedimentisphaerales bacterium]|nr:hypothetical protein [Sedimentisphaerales bacterium]